MLFFMFSLCLFAGISRADDFTAEVENNQVVAGEPFVLTLTYSGNEKNIQPDLSVLQNDFQIYSNGSSVQTSYINGVMTQQLSWALGLVTLKDGDITIPPISAGNLRTKSIDLKVLPAGSTILANSQNSKSNASASPKFEAEFSIDEKNPYVKQEITGTLTIKDYVGLEFVSDPVFLNAEDWQIKILEQPSVSQISGGREIKLNFAMFALNPTTTEVPSLQWKAVYFDMSAQPQRHGFGFFDLSDFSAVRGVQKPAIIQTRPQKISIKPIPKEYENEFWLPAKALNLVQKWEDKNPEFKVGETISREIILSAAGILDSELPELEFATPENIKQYPENPQFSLSVYKAHPVAQATYRIVYIPQKSGETTLPEISLPWFNTKTGKPETARIPAQKITIAENLDYQEISEAPAPKVKIEPERKPLAVQQTANSEQHYLWLILAFVGGMLLSYLLFATRKSTPKEEKTLNKIRKNLKNGDYRRLRDNLIKWGNENFADSSVHNLNDLALLIGEEDFSLQMQLLNRIVYADTKEKPDYDVILQSLKKRLHNRKKTEERTPLPRLYK